MVGPLGAQGRVFPGEVRGPSMSLSRTREGLGGSVQRHAIRLSLGEGQVRGQVAGAPVHLTVQETAGGGLEVSGLFAGQLTRLTLSEDRLEGRAGVCSYTLRAVEGGFEGPSTCAGLQQVALTFPRDLWRSPAEQGAMLALLLTPIPAQ